MRPLRSFGKQGERRGAGAARAAGCRRAIGSERASLSGLCDNLIEAARLLGAGDAIASRRENNRAAGGLSVYDVRRGRRGALLMECIAATALFGILLTIVVPVVTGIGSVREAARQQQVANIQLGNVLERIAARRQRGDGVREAAAAVQSSMESSALLPDARLVMDVAEETDAVGAVRVSTRLTWPSGEGRPDASAELHAYFVDAGPGVSP